MPLLHHTHITERQGDAALDLVAERRLEIMKRNSSAAVLGLRIPKNSA